MRLRPAAALAALALVTATCTGSDPGTPTPPPERPSSTGLVPPSPETVSPAPRGAGSAAAAAERLCEVAAPDPGASSDVAAEGPTPPVIAEVMRQVERLRGFGYSEPVAAQPVDQAEIARDLVAYADVAYPEGQFARRSLAWDTIGVIADGTNLREAYESYGSSQVIGYYDTVTGELKFIGTDRPSPLERVTLAHELTHAIDDQRFGLERLDALGAACRDEEAAAALALVEGNATFFMLRWAQTFLTAEEQVRLGIEAATQDPSAEGIPPFVVRLLAWSYEEGLRFVGALESRGGLEAVDAAFSELPTSTEQIIHPERYPNDAPTPVDVPDLSDELGPGWEDLDVMSIGEAWLQIALGLRLEGSAAAAAAAGWDGGVYRAWSNGTDTAVVLATVWDTERDAEEFASSMDRWLDEANQRAGVHPVDGDEIWILFANDPATVGTLELAVP